MAMEENIIPCSLAKSLSKSRPKIWICTRVLILFQINIEKCSLYSTEPKMWSWHDSICTLVDRRIKQCRLKPKQYDAATHIAA